MPVGSKYQPLSVEYADRIGTELHVFNDRGRLLNSLGKQLAGFFGVIGFYDLLQSTRVIDENSGQLRIKCRSQQCGVKCSLSSSVTANQLPDRIVLEKFEGRAADSAAAGWRECVSNARRLESSNADR